MKYINVDIKEIVAYENGIEGDKIVETYGEELGYIVWMYCKTSNPVIFDENKDLIRDVYKKYIKFDSSIIRPHAELFFYRLKKVIYLNREFLEKRSWTNPIVIRQSFRRNMYTVQGGIDRWHVMNNLKIESYNCLYLQNIEFSEDFAPRLKKEFTPDTTFDYFYNERTKRFQFNYNTPFDERSDFNLKKWLKQDYIEDGVSSIVREPNRVSLRDYHIRKMKRKIKGR